ncbi:hypothetical protein IFM89_034917 [Coptis chinensis]|uniref:rRNA biogenesis protein RRP36 n=1 Tax=Coptis chinensis TaxID=261450 RepID=A0A835I7B7_9MAGN|nr:hypothetical protein IFM89_034917 [Coptis chinensis]
MLLEQIWNSKVCCFRYEDEPVEADIEEGVEEDVENNNNNNEDIPDPLLGDDEEKEEQKTVQKDRKTSKYMTKYKRARILGTRALQISMNAPVMVELEGETDPLEEDLEIEREIENKLAHVSFEELQKARSNGFHAMHQKIKEEKMGGRVNKNRPMEISSKKPVGRFREVIQVPKQVIRDPRFESLCGNLDTDWMLELFGLSFFNAITRTFWFKRRYSFIYEAELPAEKEELKKLLKKSNDPEVIADLKNRLSSITAGAGKLEAFIEKKRRKNASKDHRYVPYRRPTI